MIALILFVIIVYSIWHIARQCFTDYIAGDDIE